MDVKLFDLHKENSWIKEGFFRKFEILYDTGNFTLGYGRGPVEDLEDIFRNHCGCRHAIAVSSGTFALELASVALGLMAGDEVIVPANTYLTTATMPALRGATMVEADVDPETWNLSPATVAPLLTDKTRAIFAVNLYGNPCPYDELQEFGVPIVEDAAHSHGAEYLGRSSGALGNCSAFSFFPAKVFGGIGDGGMMLLDDGADVDVLRAYRNCGQLKPHYGIVPSPLGRMHVLQALFLIEKWSIFDKILGHRRRIAAVYDSYFKDSQVIPQRVPVGCRSSYFAYVVRVPKRDAVGEALQERGIPWTIQYRYLLHEQPFWLQISTQRTKTPVAERLSSEIMSLPMNCSVTEEQAGYVAENLLDCVQRC